MYLFGIYVIFVSHNFNNLLKKKYYEYQNNHCPKHTSRAHSRSYNIFCHAATMVNEKFWNHVNIDDYVFIMFQPTVYTNLLDFLIILNKKKIFFYTFI
jgi:hypothetical protein